MSEHPPRNGAEREPENQEGTHLPEQAPVTGGTTNPEITKGLIQRMKEKFGGKASENSNDNHDHGANDNHGHAEHAHEHPGSLLGLWGFLIGKAFKAAISGASSGGGGGHSAPKADSHGGGGGGHH